MIVAQNNLLIEFKRNSIDSHYKLMINSYMEIHKQTCNRDDCALKSNKMKKNLINRIGKNGIAE